MKFTVKVRKIVNDVVEVEADEPQDAIVAAEKLPDVAQVLGIEERDEDHG